MERGEIIIYNLSFSLEACSTTLSTPRADSQLIAGLTSLSDALQAPRALLTLAAWSTHELPWWPPQLTSPPPSGWGTISPDLAQLRSKNGEHSSLPRQYPRRGTYRHVQVASQVLTDTAQLPAWAATRLGSAPCHREEWGRLPPGAAGGPAHQSLPRRFPGGGLCKAHCPAFQIMC